MLLAWGLWQNPYKYDIVTIGPVPLMLALGLQASPTDPSLSGLRFSWPLLLLLLGEEVCVSFSVAVIIFWLAGSADRDIPDIYRLLSLLLIVVAAIGLLY
jgi:hypothetical protein